MLFRYNLLPSPPPPPHFHYYYIPPFSDFSFGATKIARAIIPRGTKIFALIVLTFADFFFGFYHLTGYLFSPQFSLLFFSFLFAIYVSSHLRIYSVYFGREWERRPTVLINLASPTFPFYISLRFLSSFSPLTYL